MAKLQTSAASKGIAKQTPGEEVFRMEQTVGESDKEQLKDLLEAGAFSDAQFMDDYICGLNFPCDALKKVVMAFFLLGGKCGGQLHGSNKTDEGLHACRQRLHSRPKSDALLRVDVIRADTGIARLESGCACPNRVLSGCE